MFKKLSDYILLKLGILELRHSLELTEKKLNDRFDFLGAYMNLVQAEDIAIDPSIAAKVQKDLQTEFGLEEINMATHKNDVMFAKKAFHRKKSWTLAVAMAEYRVSCPATFPQQKS